MANKSWLPTWADRGRDLEQFRGFKTQVDSLFEDWSAAAWAASWLRASMWPRMVNP